MRQIAIYGKGGIGKSTVSANITAALALSGGKVLQVGCDPKHDSTRLLLGGNSLNTVLDYIRKTPPLEQKMKDIMALGYAGVHCVEAGGPEAGVGCAGRGILSAFKLLEDLGVRDMGFSHVLYDVLGDVVCGGFAVPVRQDYADEIYIVTSGEFMSLYAANNILKGIRNYGEDSKRIGGIIYNARGIEEEDRRLERFSKAVDLPIVLHLNRDDQFARAEKAGKCLLEYAPECSSAKKLFQLANEVKEGRALYLSKPLGEEDLERVVLGLEKKEEQSYSSKKTNSEVEIEVQANEEGESNAFSFVSKNVKHREPLHSCAFNGVIYVCSQVDGAVTISHGPRTCAHMAYQAVSSVGRRAFFEDGNIQKHHIMPQIISTDLKEDTSVFGGNDLLAATIDKALALKPSALFVVTTCVPGIIGDEVRIQHVKDIPVVLIAADGDIAGDYMQGNLMAHMELAKVLIDQNVKPDMRYVNIVAEQQVSKQTEAHFLEMEKIFSRLGLQLNCRFISATNVDRLKNFKRAGINILATNDYKGRILKDFLEKEFDSRFMENCFPVGYSATVDFIQELGGILRLEGEMDDILSAYQNDFDRQIAVIKPYLKGKRILIAIHNRNIDWILEVVKALEMDLLELGIINSCIEDQFISRYKEDLPIVSNYRFEDQVEHIRSLKPDVVLTSFSTSVLSRDVFCDVIPYNPAVGIAAGVDLAKRWMQIVHWNVSENWKKDEEYFRKYNA